MSSESTQNMQQYGTKIACTEVSNFFKSYGDKKRDTTFFPGVLWFGPLVSPGE